MNLDLQIKDLITLIAEGVQGPRTDSNEDAKDERREAG
jgi:hypothetical protein